MHVIGTAGHVDHGKSTLVTALTGMDPDRFEEEKRRGLTIDLGFAWLTLPSGEEVGIVDVPGHERFIKNMLAGAGGITACLFVVAASEGWMPQSAEHLSIIDILGIRSAVVAVTKADTVDAEVLALCVDEVSEHIAASSIAGAPVVTCSGTTGQGLDELVGALDRVLAATSVPANVGRPRLWVDRVFTIAGAGTVVTGTLAGGAFSVGDEVEISPEGRRARIRSIQSHKKQVPVIQPGNRTALNLAGLERQGAERGDAVVRSGQWRPTGRIDAVVRVLGSELSGHDYELTEKGARLLHVGSAETPVRIRLIGRASIPAGELGYAQLWLRDALPLGPRDRFVLRDSGRAITFGGGEVLDPAPRPARGRDTGRAELLATIARSDPEGALAALLEAEGQLPIADAMFRSGARSRPAGAVPLGTALVAQSRFGELIKAVHNGLEAFHRENPLQRGMARERLRQELGLEAPAFDALLAALDDVAEDGAVVRLGSFSVRLEPEQRAARERVVAAIEAHGFQPPLAQDLDAPNELLRALVESGDLVKIGDFYLTSDQGAEARARVRARIEASGPITVAEIRDLLGTSRKYAVPLCEWLDSTGATVRQGDVRLLGPTP